MNPMNGDLAAPVIEPGLQVGLSPELYHRDPCIAPSLSSSIARTLLTRSPLHAWWEHPRLNPDCVREESRRFDLGTVAHRLLIGKGRDYVAIDAADYRTKAAQQAAATIREAGKTPILTSDLVAAEGMVIAARQQLVKIPGCRDLFDPNAGDGEVPIVFQEEGVWCRSLLDWLPADFLTFCDYKTRDGSAHPGALGRHMAEMGYEVQAAFYERAVASLDADLLGRIQPIFVFQEIKPPYALSVVTLDEEAMDIGRKKVDLAIATWRKCLDTNTWPGYPLCITPVMYPTYAVSAWADREAEHYLNDHGYDPISMTRPGVTGGARLE